MKLGKVIEILESVDPDTLCNVGFEEPHSNRGYYRDLGLTPTEYVTAGEMLETAKSCVGQVFTGYKGGEFKMGLDTDVHISHWGESGYELSRAVLYLMLGMYDEAERSILGTI